MTDKTLLGIHEAGHAVVARELGCTVLGYERGPDYCACVFTGVTNQVDLRRIRAGGAAAELVVLGQIISSASVLRGDLLDDGLFSSWTKFKAAVDEVAAWLSAEDVLAEAAIAVHALL